MSAPGTTPGPWAAEPVTKHSAPNERPWIGRLHEGRYSALSCGETQAEAIANARLIAAAPDLFEAVTHARELIDQLALRFPEADEKFDGTWASYSDEFDAALAAVRSEPKA